MQAYMRVDPLTSKTIYTTRNSNSHKNELCSYINCARIQWAILPENNQMDDASCLHSCLTGKFYSERERFPQNLLNSCDHPLLRHGTLFPCNWLPTSSCFRTIKVLPGCPFSTFGFPFFRINASHNGSINPKSIQCIMLSMHLGFPFITIATEILFCHGCTYGSLILISNYESHIIRRQMTCQ